MAQCKSTRADGNRCQAEAQSGSTYCYWHDPATRDQMLEASRRGGKKGRREADIPEAEPLSPEKARAILAGLAEALISGAMSAETARAVGYLLQIEQKIYDTQELEKRIESLERAQELHLSQ